MTKLAGKKTHFIGIGGAGMSGLAKILLEKNFTVSGSDLKESPSTDLLRSLGATVAIGQKAENIDDDVDLVVYSSAIKPDNPEMVEARSRNLEIISRAALLARIMAQQESLAIAGAHGKTTTTGMISLMLEKAGLKPSIVIGGLLPQIGANAKIGSGRYLISEADESDGSFLILHPKMAVITNIERDHLDFYENLNRIIDAFEKFVQQLPQDGFAIVGLDNEIVADMVKRIPGHYIGFGLQNADADYQAVDIVLHKNGSTCTILERGEMLGQLDLQVPGKHNIQNALAAIAFGRTIGMEFPMITAGLQAFTGVGRRFEKLGEGLGITVVDDYAHHPTEIRATLQAALQMGYQRVICVFQPHRYSRTKALAEEFGSAFTGADMVVINEIYSASEKPLPGVSAQLLVDAIQKNGQKEVSYAPTEEAVLQFLHKNMQAGDLVLIMGAGNIRHAGELLAQELEAWSCQ